MLEAAFRVRRAARVHGRRLDDGAARSDEPPEACPRVERGDGTGIRAAAADRRDDREILPECREVELRVKATAPPPGSCTDPRIDTAGLDDKTLYDPARFPQILRAQTDLLVQAMACGLSQVGVLQCSMHTSELVMSRFPATEMYDPRFDMRSHQASHYGASHDRTKREFTDYLKQRRWFVQQLGYLLDSLKQRPEGDGSMLDYSIVLCCSEVSDGNTHSHDDMPFLLAGGAGGRLTTGRLLTYSGRRHADLLVSIAHAMNQPIPSFGQASSGPLPGLLR